MVSVDSFYFPTGIDAARRYARFLEESLFESIWVADSQQLYTDAYVTLAVCAMETETLGLRTGVTNPVSRHPSVTANAIATVNQLSGDRAGIGIGAGDSGVYSIGKQPAKASELHEAVEQIQTLLSGDAVEFGGEEFVLKQANGTVKVHVAAEGPVTLRMAGQVVDGIMFGGGSAPDVIRSVAHENLRVGAERAGKSLDDLEITTLTPGCVADTREEATRTLMHMLEPIAYHNFSHSVESAPEELHDDLRRLVEAHEFREHGDQDARSPEELPQRVQDYLGERWAIAGPPEYCRERLRALDDVGVDNVMITFPTGAPLEHAREFDRTVLRPMSE
ncbi:LLM class flavin-dependent oxidoreductase [Halomarina halobia]|uniref:LLM class flavin-dependent oxidoreductase n=1 Tax=Halomarina halobia TaxID=3033386 RepID=A0ABD6AEM3_9EURY|nr:LLM class flavin-dependent oxidoreductase [Halomarina sp. PSR21]